MYDRVQTYRLYEQIVEQIKERILRGELQPGDQLPTERELAEGFGVSRVAVREGIKALVHSGLVDVQPGRGTFVIDGASRGLHRSLDLVVKMHKNGQAISDLVQIREMLEPEIAALAATNVTDDNLQTMQTAVEAMDLALHDPDVYSTADLDFHRAVAAATQNQLLPIILDPVVDLLLEQRQRMFAISGAPERGQGHHKHILDAIAKHDPHAARLAMRAHLEQVRVDTEAAEAINAHPARRRSP